MSLLNRRESLKLFLAGLLQSSATVVLASSVLPAGRPGAASSSAGQGPAKDLEERANQVAEARVPLLEESEATFNEFLNGAFANGGGFRNGGFVNGGFRKGGFANGGFTNGGFRKGGFANGGWRN